MSKGELSPRQQALLELACDPAFQVTGVSIYGPREFRTAKSLERRGLGCLDVLDRFTPTLEGRALQHQGNEGHG